jgi:hypothetical protein
LASPHLLKLCPKIPLSLFMPKISLSNHHQTYLDPGMSASLVPEQAVMTLDEYIDLCANLHNTLLAKSIPSNLPPPGTSTELLQRYESFRANGPFNAHDPYIPPSLDPLSPLAKLLSQLKVTTCPRMGDAAHLTPLLYQPMPLLFFPALYSNELNEADSPFLLLYPQRLPFDSQSADDGGLFVDLYDLRGIWLGAPPGPGNLPLLEDWIPLDYLLKLEISRWESGRYIHDPTAQDGLKIQKWVPISSNTTTMTTATPMPNLQVAEAITEWERLLNSIQAKMPPSSTGNDRAEPLRSEALQGLHLSTFAQHYLTHARRPKSWTFVAPGIGTFTSEASLREAYASELTTAFRRTLETSGEGEDWVTLLLPSVAVAAAAPDDVGSTVLQLPVRVPVDVDRHPDVGINSFDKPWGFGKATVDRRAGLYTSWSDERDGDLVQLVCPSGRTDASVFAGACLWGSDRLPRLAEVLGHWADLVEDGVWAVGRDGVVEDAAWWDLNVDAANLNWDDVVE